MEDSPETDTRMGFHKHPESLSNFTFQVQDCQNNQNWNDQNWKKIVNIFLAILNFKFSNSYNFCACVLLPQARLEAAEKYQEFATKAKNLLQASSKQVIDLLKR